MDKNNTGKPALPAGRYLKYAIGEIILVVIGILIALQVNNWNEKRKDRLLEENYLQWLKADLQKNQKQLIFSKGLCDIRLNQIDLITKAIENPDDSIINPNELVESIEKVTWKSYLPLSKIVYSELQNTGRLVLIDSKNLREELANYYAEAEHWEMVLKSIEYQGEFSKETAGLLNKDILKQIEISEPNEMEKAKNYSINNIDELKAKTIITRLANNSNATKWLPQINHYHVLSKEVIELLISKNHQLLDIVEHNLN